MAQLTKELDQAKDEEVVATSGAAQKAALYAPAALLAAAALGTGWRLPLFIIAAPRWLTYTPIRVSDPEYSHQRHPAAHHPSFPHPPLSSLCAAGSGWWGR